MVNNVKTYKCCVCKAYLPREMFYKDGSRSSGLASRCRSCCRGGCAVHIGPDRREMYLLKLNTPIDMLGLDLWWCKDCDRYLPASSFYSLPGAKRGFFSRCDRCYCEEKKTRYYYQKHVNHNSHEMLWRKVVRARWRSNASCAARSAVDMGIIKAMDRCERCGDPATNGHHHSYDFDRWLHVEWLCDRCHGVVHRGSPIT